MNEQDVQIESSHASPETLEMEPSQLPAQSGVSENRQPNLRTSTPDEDGAALASKAGPQLKPPVGVTMGFILGLSAAVLYTMANIALRHCISVDPFLVSAVKAAPTVILLGPFLLWMLASGEPIANSGRMVPRFIVVSIIGQFVGNAAFQIALGTIGLAASVPITLGVLIIGGAVLGRLLLKEPVSSRSAVAMVTLIIAVIVLSHPSTSQTPEKSILNLPLWVGAMFAAASGAAYALFGVVMRQTLIGGVSAPATMFISGVVGTISLWSVALLRLGIEPIAAVDTSQWTMMTAAGLLNFSAFVALTVSLKALPVVAVNLINASQVALAAIAGVILFSEPVTWPLSLGLILTFAGLIVLANRRSQPSTKAD
ncbi:MAG: DMT family transporter [Rubripirellula sp.]|nr:DMT family transporter [Rubripirellula sp.]